MKPTLLQACRTSLLTTLLAVALPQTGLAGTNGMFLGNGNGYMFRLSSSPLASSRGG